MKNEIDRKTEAEILTRHMGQPTPDRLANIDTCLGMIKDAWKHGFDAGLQHKPDRPKAAVKKAAKKTR